MAAQFYTCEMVKRSIYMPTNMVLYRKKPRCLLVETGTGEVAAGELLRPSARTLIWTRQAAVTADVGGRGSERNWRAQVTRECLTRLCVCILYAPMLLR